MKTLHSLLFSALTFFATKSMAHAGPEAMERHLIEHLLIALAICLAVGCGLLRLLQRWEDSNR